MIDDKALIDKLLATAAASVISMEMLNRPLDARAILDKVYALLDGRKDEADVFNEHLKYLSERMKEIARMDKEMKDLVR